MSTLTLTFSKATAIEAVKSDTYITSSVDRGADSVKNAGIAYNEAAGDDAHHEKKIERLIREAVSKFAAELAEFVDSASGSITTTIDTNITITMTVTSRYLSGLANPLSGIALSYVVNMSLYGWWISIKPEMAKNFAALATDALVYLRKCFAKKAPSVAGSSYDDVTGRIDDDPSPTPGPSPDPDPDPEPTEHTYDTYASEHVTTGVGEGGIDDDCVVVPIADIVSVYNEHGNASLSGAVENCVCIYLSDDKVSADISQGLGDGTTTTWGEFDDQAECITLPLSFNSNMINLISDEYGHGNWFIAIKPQSDSASLSSVSLVYTE